MTSAGTGITHSEYNAHAEQPVHFLQIWIVPSERRLAPKYYTRHYTDADKADTLVRVPPRATIPKRARCFNHMG